MEVNQWEDNPEVNTESGDGALLRSFYLQQLL